VRGARSRAKEEPTVYTRQAIAYPDTPPRETRLEPIIFLIALLGHVSCAEFFLPVLWNLSEAISSAFFVSFPVSQLREARDESDRERSRACDATNRSSDGEECGSAHARSHEEGS
jgi:hypothetical protein